MTISDLKKLVDHLAAKHPERRVMVFGDPDGNGCHDVDDAYTETIWDQSNHETTDREYLRLRKREALPDGYETVYALWPKHTR